MPRPPAPFCLFHLISSSNPASVYPLPSLLTVVPTNYGAPSNPSPVFSPFLAPHRESELVLGPGETAPASWGLTWLMGTQEQWREG